jgi:hypothetical protein
MAVGALGHEHHAAAARRRAAAPGQRGRALLRTFGYVGSIASSAITGIVFHASVSGSGVQLIAWIMIGVSLALVLISVLDRTLPGKAGS